MSAVTTTKKDAASDALNLDRDQLGELLRAVKTLRGLVAEGAPAPLDRYALIDAWGARICGASPGGGEVQLAISFGCQGGPKGGFAVDLRDFARALDARKDCDVSLEFAGGILTITPSPARGPLPAVPGAAFEAALAHRGPGERPGAHADAAIPAAVLREVLAKTAYASSTDETRFHLCGVHLEAAGGGLLRAVATDGHRLSKIDRPCANAGGALRTGGLTLPSPAVEALLRLIPRRRGYDGVVLAGRAPSGRVVFRDPDDAWELSAMPCGGVFPPWDKVVPKSWPTSALIDRRALLRALEAFRKSEDGVVVEVRESSVGLRDKSSAMVNPLHVVPAEVIHDKYGEPEAVGVNTRYLYEPLEQMAGDKVHLRVNTPLDPVGISDASDPGYTCVTMPMRV